MKGDNIMGKILFLGDYLPNLSMASLRNHKTIQAMANEGWEVYLLSDSWCGLEKHSAVRYIPKENNFIREHLYVDPIQSNYSNVDISMVALARQICIQYEFDFIYVSSLRDYGIVSEIISGYFSIPTILSMQSDGAIYSIYELYTKNWLQSYIEKVDTLLVHKHNRSFYNNYEDSTNIVEIMPYSFDNKVQSFNENLASYVLYMEGLHDRISPEYILWKINEITGNKNPKTFIGSNVNHDKLTKILNKLNAEPVDLNDGIESINALSGSIAIIAECLLDKSEVCVDKALMLMSYGLYPLVNKGTYDVLEYYYNLKYKRKNEFFIIESVDVSSNSSVLGGGLNG